MLSFAQYGVLGLLIIAGMAGWIDLHPSITRNDLEATRRELGELNRFVRETAVPTIIENNDLHRRVTEQLAVLLAKRTTR